MPKPDLKDLVVLPISDWFSLGKELNIPREKLLLIESNFHHDMQTCKRKVFQCWLESTSEASYHQLMVALRNIGDDSLTEELCKKYGKRPLIVNYNVLLVYVCPMLIFSIQPEATRDEVQPNYPSSSVTMPKQGTYSSVCKITKHDIVFSMLIMGLIMFVEVTHFYSGFK